MVDIHAIQMKLTLYIYIIARHNCAKLMFKFGRNLRSGNTKERHFV